MSVPVCVCNVAYLVHLRHMVQLHSAIGTLQDLLLPLAASLLLVYQLISAVLDCYDNPHLCSHTKVLTSPAAQGAHSS